MERYIVPAIFVIIMLVSWGIVITHALHLYRNPQYSYQTKRRVFEGVVWFQAVAMVTSVLLIANLTTIKW